MKHADELEEQGFTIDRLCYPWHAHRYDMDESRTERHDCYTELESRAVREEYLGTLGYFLRPDHILWEGIEKYSLCLVAPWERLHVYASNRDWAARWACKLVTSMKESTDGSI